MWFRIWVASLTTIIMNISVSILKWILLIDFLILYWFRKAGCFFCMRLAAPLQGELCQPSAPVTQAYCGETLGGALGALLTSCDVW
jgi:hypothetical protein